MTETDIARRADALYYDTRATQRRQLCEMVARREAENARLRKERDFCLAQVPDCDECEAMRDCDECLRADASHKERKALEAENAELREQLARARDPQRIGGQADPESFAYAIEQLREFRWQHATNDEDAIPYINGVAEAHERESDRLRAKLAELYPFVGETCPDSCRWRERCEELNYPVCFAYSAYLAELRELGVEVDG